MLSLRRKFFKNLRPKRKLLAVVVLQSKDQVTFQIGQHLDHHIVQQYHPKKSQDKKGQIGNRLTQLSGQTLTLMAMVTIQLEQVQIHALMKQDSHSKAMFSAV